MNKLLATIFLIFSYGISSAQDCEGIESKFDKFDNEKKINSHPLWDVSFYKYIKKGVSSYYISLKVDANTVVVNEKGLTIILDNGQKIRKPNQEISVEVNQERGLHNGDYEYSAFFKLSPVEINLLKTYKITAYKLYIFDYDLDEDHQQHEFDAFNCVLNTK